MQSRLQVARRLPDQAFPLTRLLILVLLLLIATPSQATGTLTANLVLDTYVVNTPSKYSFQISPSSALSASDTITISFDPALGIVLPDDPKCDGLTNFNSNPLCKRLSASQVSVPCTAIRADQSIYSFTISGVKNPPAAISVTDQIIVATVTSGFKVDKSSNIYVTYQARLLPTTDGSMTSSDPTVGVYAPLVAEFRLANDVPTDGKIVVVFPKYDDKTQGATFMGSMVTSSTVSRCRVAFSTPTCSVQVGSDTDTVTVEGAFVKQGLNSAGSLLKVIINQVHNPPSLRPKTGFSIFTTNANGDKIDVCQGLSLTMQTPATAALLNSYVQLDGNLGLNEFGTYDFYYQTSNPIPVGSTLHVTIPPLISFDSISNVSYTGHVNMKKTLAVQQGSSPQEIILNNAVENYLTAGIGLLFTLDGLKNPATTQRSQSFELRIFDSQGYAIEVLTEGLSVSAVAGRLKAVQFQPTDVLGIRLYSTEQLCKFTLTSDLNQDAKLTIRMDNNVETFQIASSQNCSVEGLDMGVAADQISCYQNQTSREIIIKNFVQSSYPGNQKVQFTLKNTRIRNPMSSASPAEVTVLTAADKVTLDYGRSTSWFGEPTGLTMAKIRPNSLQTGIADVEYLVTLEAPGPILQYSTVTIQFPNASQVENVKLIEERCGNYYKSGLPEKIGSANPMKCLVEGQNVTISNMFAFGPTRDLPTFQFTVPGIRNPRAANQATQSFKIYISQGNSPLYNVTDGVSVQATTASKFASVSALPSSMVTQAKATYTFRIMTLLAPEDQDYLRIQIPPQITLPNSPVCKSTTSQVVNSTNSQVIFECAKLSASTLKVTVTNTSINATGFEFEVLDLFNPQTTAPTGSFAFTQFDGAGFSVQTSDTNITLTMTSGRPLEAYRLQMTPENFQPNAISNYVTLFQPATVLEGMYLEIEFPHETQLQVSSGCSSVDCTRRGQTLTVQAHNLFNVTNVQNPPAKIITNPFSLKSFSKDGYLIEVLEHFQLNFQCAAPCNSCTQGSNSHCASCDSSGKYLLWEGMCYSKCPRGLYLSQTSAKNGTTVSECQPCAPTCASCLDLTTCTSCNPGATYVNETCPKDLPFPYFMPSLCLGVLWIIIASLAELRKHSSRWIPLTLTGLAYCNTLLCVEELMLYSTYNMHKVFLNVVLAGIIVPALLSAIFIVAWMVRFKKDYNVRIHLRKHRAVHLFALCSTFIGDYRCWKMLYTNMGKSTQMLAFKVQFKAYNRAWSFACLISDCFLCFAGVQAFTQGNQKSLILVQMMAVERVIISGSLIALTVTEWAFKSKLSREDKEAIKVQSGIEEDPPIDATQVHLTPISYDNWQTSKLSDQDKLEAQIVAFEASYQSDKLSSIKEESQPSPETVTRKKKGKRVVRVQGHRSDTSDDFKMAVTPADFNEANGRIVSTKRMQKSRRSPEAQTKNVIVPSISAGKLQGASMGYQSDEWQAGTPAARKKVLRLKDGQAQTQPQFHSASPVKRLGALHHTAQFGQSFRSIQQEEEELSETAEKFKHAGKAGRYASHTKMSKSRLDATKQFEEDLKHDSSHPAMRRQKKNLKRNASSIIDPSVYLENQQVRATLINSGQKQIISYSPSKQSL